MAPTLPAELALAVVQHTPHDDLASWCDAVGSITHKEALYHRYDPKRYLKALTPEVEKLLSFMRSSSVVLSGSRAAAFFYENATTSKSDWDFYCSAGHAGVAQFSYQMTTIGAQWEPGDWDEHEADFYGAGFVILNGTIGTQKIQVVWREGTCAFKSIVEFHSSIVQCFISGYCAGSLYHNISSRGKLIAWRLNTEEHPERNRNAPACIKKYKSRGFEVTIYDRSSVGPKDMAAEVLQLDPMVKSHHNKPRSLLDDGSLVIDFRPYRPNLNAVQEALHDKTVQEIYQASWVELTTLDGTSLDVEKGYRLRVHNQLRALKTAIRLKYQDTKEPLAPEYQELGIFTLHQKYKDPSANTGLFAQNFGYSPRRYESMVKIAGREEETGYEVPWMIGTGRRYPCISAIKDHCRPL